MLDELTDDQRAAVTHPAGPLVVVAGAGAGKTAVLSRRLAWLVQHGAASSEVLALTFTQKAAAELRGRAESLLRRSHETLRVMTFHAWAGELCRVHGVDEGLLPARDIASDEERALMMLGRIGELDLRHYDMRADPAAVVDRLLRRIDRFRDNLITPDDALAWARDRVQNAARPRDRVFAERDVEFAAAFLAHDRWLDEARAEDFGASLARAIGLLRSHPERRQAVREGTRHVLVDEFQDTNYAQAQLLYEVADDAESVVVVGDDDQGIYRFRGATNKNLVDFRDRYPGGSEVRLLTNFRSHQRILDAAGAVVEPLPERDPKELRAPSGLDGPVPRVWSSSDPEAEAFAVAREVRRLADEGIPYEEQAILMRAVRLEAPGIVRALEAEGLPYQVRGGLGLFERREVRDAVAWLRAATDPADAHAHLRAAGDPSLGIPWARAASAVAAAEGGPVAETLAGIAHEEGAERYLDLLDAVGREAVRGTALEALRGAIDLTGLRGRSLSLGGAAGAARLAGLASLERLARAVVARQPDLEAAGLAERRTDLARVGHRGGDAASSRTLGVQVMTVHQAKGLEFDVVFVVGLVQAAWPGKDRSSVGVPEALLPETLPPERDAHIAESRRLAYVAMTRARHHLVLSMWSANARGVAQRPSPFLEEAQEAVGTEVEIVGESVHEAALLQVAALRERFEQAALAAAEEASGPRGAGLREDALAAAALLIDARSEALHPAPPEPPVPPAPRSPRPGQNLTVTDIVTYRRCPLQYRFMRVDRIPPRPAPERDIGIAVHAALEAHYRPNGEFRDGAQLVGRVERELERTGVTRCPEGRQALRRAHEELPAYHERQGARGERPVAVEWDFTLTLGPHRVRGRIDRIDRYPDGYQLVDYKTGAPPRGTDGLDTLPIRLYAAGLLEARDTVARGGALHYVLDGEARPVECDPPMVEGARAEAAELADRIAVGDDEPTPGWHCRSCDFALLCPAQDR